MRLSRPDRSGIEDLREPEAADPFRRTSLSSGSHRTASKRRSINSVYRKNLQPVVYVTGDVAGGEESPVYAILKMSEAIDKIQVAGWLRREAIQGHDACPSAPTAISMKWDGEWHITVEVFRDLGLAFAAVLVLDLRAGRGLVQLVRDAAGHHGADSADACRHSARACV